MAYGVVRTDKMHGTIYGSPDLANIRCTKDIENGHFVALGAVETDNREVYAMVEPSTTPAVNDLFLIASEEVCKDKKYESLDQFINKKGSIARGYRLCKNDEFSLTKDCFEISGSFTPAVGSQLVVTSGARGDMGMLMNSAVSNGSVVAKIIAVEDEGPTKWYVFRVV